MLIQIDPSSATPLFEQIAASIQAEVASGAIASGERLPAATELATSLQVNRNTVLRAFQQLRDEGLIVLRRGSGAVVTGKANGIRELSAKVALLVEEARRLGVGPLTLSRLITEATA